MGVISWCCIKGVIRTSNDTHRAPRWLCATLNTPCHSYVSGRSSFGRRLWTGAARHRLPFISKCWTAPRTRRRPWGCTRHLCTRARSWTKACRTLACWWPGHLSCTCDSHAHVRLRTRNRRAREKKRRSLHEAPFRSQGFPLIALDYAVCCLLHYRFSRWALGFQKHANKLPLFDQKVSNNAGGDPNIR